MNWKKIFIPTLLVIIGEGIFILPFLISRIFRPTFLKVFNINNFELGSAFSLYGIVAMVSYFLGGPIADRFSPKKLIFVSLLLTSLGGFYLAQIPTVGHLTLLYGFWGLSTILLFWAAYIKIIRLYWPNHQQGKGFGIIDAGRGLVGALLATIAVGVFSLYFKEETSPHDTPYLISGLKTVIIIFSIVTFVCSILILIFLNNKILKKEISTKQLSWEGIKKMSSVRAVWYNALIVLCAYVGYKCTDDFSLYASDVLKYNDLEAANVGAIAFWMRPIAAVLAGYLGDKFFHTKMVFIAFILLLFGSILLILGTVKSSLGIILIITISVTCLGIYGLRGLYFALMTEAQLNIKYIGSAIGIISVIGYSPDIFMGPLMGYVLDEYPGVLGHRYLFCILAFFSTFGMICTLFFKKSIKSLSVIHSPLK